DAERGRIYVVDKTARVQRFDLEGVFERSWAMPRSENGKPTGVTIDGDGRVVVADTHEHRIAIFSPDGELLETFGEYGEGPGQFIYPTDVAIAADGTWFVSEYGGNDRVQLFDSDRRPVGSIGFMGHDDEGDSPGLLRPQSIAWDDEAGELYIADAVNHRIVVTDRAGRMRRVLGGAGDAPGRLAYPYGIALDGERSLIVAEYGNNRVQRLDRLDGECLGVWGGAGIEAGRLRYPWGVDAGGGMMAVLDSGNDRVQVGELP
ncbi:MAG: NHL repeat-containing protein, partial [Planctomycetota bacterium]